MFGLIALSIITVLGLKSAAFADVQSTREVLSQYSVQNQQVLEGYDRVAASWSEYDRSHKGEWDFERLLLAVEYAAKKHAGQVRKDAEKTPYIVHPIGVAELAWNEGKVRSINVLTAALLHDTLEDTDATEEEIEALFGARVLYTVKEVTNDPTLVGPAKKQRQVDHAPDMSLDGQLVKLADRVYNVRDLSIATPSGWSKEKLDAYYGWGEKLLAKLRGTNEGLEQALQQLITAHEKEELEKQ